MTRMFSSALIVLALLFLATGCASNLPQLQTVEQVDLERFMGDWYVIAFIPIFAEKDATNGIERYDLRDDGDVDITYTFYKDSPDGEFKEYTARGFVQEDPSNAEWRVQFFWPLRFPYMVIDLADDYSYTVIGVPNRNYLWIMAREPQIESTVYEQIITRLEEQHYDISEIRQVPQVWDTEQHVTDR